MANIPTPALRELAKWAYHAAEYDGATSLDHLRSLHPDIAALIDEVQDADENRKEGEGFDESL